MGIIRTEAEEGGQIKISGWYTDIQWTSEKGDNYGHKEGSGNSFLFLLRDEMNFIKLSCKKKKSEVFHN